MERLDRREAAVYHRVLRHHLRAAFALASRLGSQGSAKTKSPGTSAFVRLPQLDGSPSVSTHALRSLTPPSLRRSAQPCASMQGKDKSILRRLSSCSTTGMAWCLAPKPPESFALGATDGQQEKRQSPKLCLSARPRKSAFASLSSLPL